MISEVIRHVVDSISPRSLAHAEGARQRAAAAGAPDMLLRLAMRVAGAQHAPAARVARRTALIVAGDHGVGDPGLSLGADHPTISALRAITSGTAALTGVARSARLPLLLVDAGVREPAHVPSGVVQVGHRPSFDLMSEPALTVAAAAMLVEAGIALVVALEAHDVLVLGALGVGSDVCAAALSGTSGTGGADPVAEAAAALATEHARSSGLELLARFGGPDTAVLTGAILAAASLAMPVVLDSYATGAAAICAARFAPASTGYLVAAHAGTFVHPAILRQLGLTPVFDVGLGQGEGTGAAMIVPLLDQVAAITARG